MVPLIKPCTFNLVAKAPGLNLGKRLSNLSATVRRWISSQFVNLSLSKRDLYCNAMWWLLFMLPEISSKKKFLYSDVFIGTINKKKFCLSCNFIDKKWHDMTYSDWEWKSFLSLRNKHDFYSKLLSNLLIC